MSSSNGTPPPSLGHSPISLQQPSQKKNPSKPKKLFRRIRCVFRSFPIINPTCKVSIGPHFHGVSSRLNDKHIHGGTRLTGTLFGYRKGRVSLALQETSKCLPMLVLELAIPTGKLLKEMGQGLVRIALECEKRNADDKIKIIDEPVWTLYCNGRKSGYGVKREPNEEDLGFMQLLHPVSMGAGVLPSPSDQPSDTPDVGELTYMRAYFERVIGSKDSETYYMLNPDGNNGPELSIFFVRV